MEGPGALTEADLTSLLKSEDGQASEKVADPVNGMAKVAERSLHAIAQHLAIIPLQHSWGRVWGSPLGRRRDVSAQGLQASGAGCGPSLPLPEAAWW